MGSPYVAAIKGVILSINPDATLVDLSHDIRPQDIRQGALVLADVSWLFPEGTIHVAVIDPGVGTGRPIVYAQIGSQHYVSPDNGLLSELIGRRAPSRIIRLENPRFWRTPVSSTFHGRDIMAPVAAHLSLGLNPADLGSEVALVKSLDLPKPRIRPGRIDGVVLEIDSFGNLVTDIGQDLLDGVPRGLHDQLASAVQTVPGVEELIRLRLRRGGPDYFADATISVGRGAAFEQAHDIADWVESALREVLPRADIVVHVEPIDRGGEDITDKIRLSAARRGLGAHAIRIYEQPDGRRVELHLEVSDSLLLEEAHDLATDFERELRETLPGVNSVVTHIEPAGDRAATVRCRPAGKLDPRKVIDDFLAEHPLPIKPHDVRVQQAGGELDVSFHCGLQPDMSITDAHELTVQLEEYLRARMPGLGRIIIHAEPE